MIATLVFDEPLPRPFKTCIVLGHVSDKEGKKESKSKGNYTPPDIILDEVKMDFAVVDAAQYGVEVPNEKTVVIGNEDMEGMDLASGARVQIGSHDFVLNGAKKLPRRVIALHEQTMQTLGVLPISTKGIKPVEVPWLEKEQRVTVKAAGTHAPGADAFRWFFFASSPPWSATRHSLSNVRALQKEFAVKLRNVYSFFTIYANIDAFDPRSGHVKVVEVPEHDRWVLSELALTTRDVTARMDDYDVYGSTQRLVAFVDALSNWWVRRSRDRFWKAGWDDDKRSAYETLYTCLVTLAKLTAPFTPYAAEAMYQSLVVKPGVAGARESVHLEDWPAADLRAIDEALSSKIEAVRALVSIGLQVRTQAKLKVRQPLRSAKVVTARLTELDDSSRRQLAEELNTLSVEIVPIESASQYVELRVKPSFRALGQRGLGKEAQALKKTMAAMTPETAGSLAAKLMAGGSETLDGVSLGRDDVEVDLVAREGFAAAGDRAGVVVLDTRLDDELRELGFVRELLNRIQTVRKEMGLEFTDRIRVQLDGSDRTKRIVTQHRESIAQEVLALEIVVGPVAGEGAQELDVEGESVRLRVSR
jgi:isoleucyl-tRNA synthetase